MNYTIQKVLFKPKYGPGITRCYARYYAVRDYQQFLDELDRLYKHLVEFTVCEITFEFGYYPVISEIVNECPD